MTLSRRDLLLGPAPAALPGALRQPMAASAAAPAGTPRWSLPAKRSFKIVENQWITLKDGTRLAARLWIPDAEAGTRSPVVLEYLPYRKRDVTRRINNATGEMLAEYGIAYARVDIRGSGDSDGLL